MRLHFPRTRRTDNHAEQNTLRTAIRRNIPRTTKRRNDESHLRTGRIPRALATPDCTLGSRWLRTGLIMCS